MSAVHPRDGLVAETCPVCLGAGRASGGWSGYSNVETSLSRCACCGGTGSVLREAPQPQEAA